METGDGMKDADGKETVIRTVEWPGLTLSQGEPTDRWRRIGEVIDKLDMHGRLAVEAGGKIAVGWPVPSVRRGEGDHG